MAPPTRPRRPARPASRDQGAAIAVPVALDPPSVDATTPTPSLSVEGQRTRDWRDQLAALTGEATLTQAQETEFFRLFSSHEAEAREAMPGLLDDFKRHVDEHGPDEAKARLTAALRAIKQQQQEATARLLASLGIDADTAPPAA